MQSLLKEILPEILNENKTALSQKLIDAINHQNKDNYKNGGESKQRSPINRKIIHSSNRYWLQPTNVR